MYGNFLSALTPCTSSSLALVISLLLVDLILQSLGIMIRGRTVATLDHFLSRKQAIPLQRLTIDAHGISKVERLSRAQIFKRVLQLTRLHRRAWHVYL